MTLPPTPYELLRYIKREFGLGEFLPGLRKQSQFQYAGIGTYQRKSSFRHLLGEPVILVHSRKAKTREVIELFPDVVFLLLESYLDGEDKETIDSPYGRLEDFLKQKGVTIRYPGLYTNESYYAALVRALEQKLAP
ncbi:MAG: hypothetical protein P1P76_10855 [Anaerolineales bacterium]|nr:hypothetical protein [Anaerolineales bacterium]